jgi:hypothetical protein
LASTSNLKAAGSFSRPLSSIFAGWFPRNIFSLVTPPGFELLSAAAVCLPGSYSGEQVDTLSCPIAGKRSNGEEN